MKPVVGREKYLAIALTVVAALLAGLLWWEWDQGVRLERELLKMRNIPVVAVKPLNVLPEFTLPAEEAGFPELISRSLFSTSRRSSAVATKGGVSSMKKGQFVLVGVLITPRQRSALLRDVQTNKAETIALNGIVRGMTVGEVESSRVVLRQGADSEELILNVQTGPKSAAASRGPSPPPQAPVAAPPVPPVQPPSAASAPAHAASGVGAPTSAPGAPVKSAEGAPPPVPPTPPGPPRADTKKQP